ncbi:hypothetical protein RND81_04G120000 [Saponaria officinalis]|uniref:Peptidase A1 domain-containing protein n=1 Tax=Saponaria officinalis TaxID=3572 RepID=A0AAW1LJW7_SAPOF
MSISKSNPTFLLAVIIVCALFQTTNSKSNIKTKGLQLRMIHIDSPDSPMYQAELTDLQRINRLLAISDYRVSYLANKTSQRRDSRYLEPDVTSPLIGHQSYNYYVQIGIGQFDDVHQPYQNNYLTFDTASAITWTQCESCRNCFYQRTPLFSNSKSRTYHPFTYTECPANNWKGDHCEGSIGYMDGAYMSGIWAHETFTFTSMSSSDEPINGLNFVCAINTYNFIAEEGVEDNVITGLLGMNKGESSLISQLGSKVEHKFSYCLQGTPGYHCQVSQMFLSFGDQISKPAIMYATPILSEEQYYVSLLDISVENKKLNIQPDLFALKPDRVVRTYFDTGSTFTYLVSAAFDNLQNAIVDYVTRYNFKLERWSGPKRGLFEECWKPLYDYAKVNLPKVTFHFDENADLIVQSTEMFVPVPFQGVPLPGLYCLAVSRAPHHDDDDHDLNVIGAYQQINQRVIVDIEKSQILFAPADCASDNH